MITRIPLTRVLIYIRTKSSLAHDDCGQAVRIAAAYLVQPRTAFMRWMLAVHLLWIVVGIGWSGKR